MATTRMRGEDLSTSGDLPELGEVVDFRLTGGDLSDHTAADFPGRLVLNIFPSIDTPTCAASVRTFNERASSIDGVTVLNISADLPFAQKRFCGTEQLPGVVTLSTFRSGFLEDTGLMLAEGPLAGLAARAVLVLDEARRVVHVQLVEDLGHEPDYAAALEAAGKAAGQG